MVTFKTGDGAIIEFDDKPLSQGGEGAVYKQYDRDGHGDIGDLAKVFHVGKSADKEEKIKAMLVVGSPTPSYSYTWAKDILYDVNTGEFRGYSMYLKDGKKEVADIYGYDSKFRKDKDWRFFVHTAKNLAQAVAGVHAKNQVIGDLNAANILVSPDDAQVTLIDTDSFHITVGSGNNAITHRCAVGMSEFIAPEIHGINFRDAPLPTFTKHTDNFSLAVLIFRLLLNGLHPFYNPDGSSLEDNIRHGVSTALTKPKKGDSFEVSYAPMVSILPVSLQNLFKRAFVDSVTAPKKRPSAQEFYDELVKLANDANIQQCNVDANHKFPVGNTECPWCGVAYKMAVLQGGGTVANIQNMSQSVSTHTPNNHGDFSQPYTQPPMTSVSMSFTGSNLPPPIKNSTNIIAKVVCGLIALVAIAIIAIGYEMIIPEMLIVFTIIAGIIAWLRLPKLDYNNSFDSPQNVPSYMLVSYQENHKLRFIFVPKWRLWIFNTLCLTLLLSSIAIIVVGVFDLLSLVWVFIGLMLMGMFGALFLFERRTLWTKNPLGIVMGVVSILAILVNVGMLVIFFV